MAVAVHARYPNLSPEVYDEVIASLELDANPPIGAILHVAGQAETGMTISEIWRTEQTFRAYLDFRLMPALQLHGVETPPEIEVTQLHNLYAVEVDTIERLGAVSLPAHYAGAAL